MQLQKAQRKRAKIKLGIQGPSGSGKTISSLYIALSLAGSWDKVAIIDSENGSAHLYSHLGDYNVLNLDAPFTPEKYIEAIRHCLKAGMEVVIIDSISHEWQGLGGILESHSQTTGNSYTAWAKLTPRHNAFVQEIVQSPVHIIGTIRMKQDYVLVDKNGKMVPEKVGLKGITREGLDYEFTLVFDLDIKHNATASKDRTSLFIDKPEFKISGETGRQILEWCNNGENPSAEAILRRINSSKSIAELLAIYKIRPEISLELTSQFEARKKELMVREQHFQTFKLAKMEQNNIMEIVHPSETLGKMTTDSSQKAFITANTIECSLDELKREHIIPVFVKDNEPVISHSEFIDVMADVAGEVYTGEQILRPSVRLSHPIKGRIPSAKDKPSSQLEEWEKTLYYERMMFVIEIPSISDEIDGNRLSLTIGGVKAYNKDNLYSRALSDQHFRIFAGFQNKICSNLCIWTDGYMGDLKVKNTGQLKACIRSLIESYNSNYHLFNMKKLVEYSITEQQFAHLIGRCRMYQHLPDIVKSDVSPMLFGDQQMGAVVKDFYRDDSQIRDRNGNINLWKLYNLFTGVNKSSYIDSFMDRSINAFSLVEQIKLALESKADCWYLN